LKSHQKGDRYDLSQITLCTHTGTHIDAPRHFLEDGATIENLRLSVFYGPCTVVTIKGILTGEDMEKLLPYCKRRVIFKGSGKAYLSHSAALVLADSNVLLAGTDSLSIAAEFDDERVHYELARGDVCVLECLDLSGIDDGEYTLCAFPVKLEGLEAAPCRAILLGQQKGY
ncbi:MAG: cyclase family protein, partial [Oscillospiraceae bacterium]|nr:cyclase family protein [Oscillospiraceae bacterium]